MTYAYTSPWGPINRRFFFEDPGKVAVLNAVNHQLSEHGDESPIAISKQELIMHIRLMHRSYKPFDEELYRPLITGQDDFITYAYTSVGWTVTEDKGHFYFTEPPPKQLGTLYPDTELPGRHLRHISMDRGNPAPIVTGILADRDADFWMDRIEREPDVPIGAGVPDQGDKDKESCRSIAAPIDYGPACPYVPDEIPEPTVPHCGSSRDGEDCFAKYCPQMVEYQGVCPYYKAWNDYWEQNE